MKKIKITFLLIITTILSIFSQNIIPSVILENINGEKIDSKTIIENERPVILSFWATWCKPCIQELTAYAENYEDWVEETNLQIIAISIDDSRNKDRVKSIVNVKGWDFDIYIDTNQNLKRAMKIVNIPHTFLIDQNKKIVWQHTSYFPGDEDILYEKLLSVSNKE